MIAPHGTGHIRTGDGGVVRVDFERGRWVATRYTARHVMTDQLYGSDAKVQEADSPLDRLSNSQGTGQPAPMEQASNSDGSPRGPHDVSFLIPRRKSVEQ
jgi:carotenoid cleavage dioxygenase-like enzyme